MFNSNPICNVGPFSKQHVIKYNSPPKRAFLLAKPESEVLEPYRHAVRHLVDLGMTVFADDINYAYLFDECHEEFQSFFQESLECTSIGIGSGSDSGATDAISSSIHSSVNSRGTIRRLTNQTLPTVDLIITFGGDGLLMHVNTLFESARATQFYSTRSIPPIMSFDFGSLGFLAPFQFEDFYAEVCRFCIYIFTYNYILYFCVYLLFMMIMFLFVD